MALQGSQGAMAEPMAVPLAEEDAASGGESETEEAEQQQPNAQEGEPKAVCCLCKKAPPRWLRAGDISLAGDTSGLSRQLPAVL